jgi:hypothetical protein
MYRNEAWMFDTDCSRFGHIELSGKMGAHHLIMAYVSALEEMRCRLLWEQGAASAGKQGMHSLASSSSSAGGVSHAVSHAVLHDVQAHDVQAHSSRTDAPEDLHKEIGEGQVGKMRKGVLLAAERTGGGAEHGGGSKEGAGNEGWTEITDEELAMLMVDGADTGVASFQLPCPGRNAPGSGNGVDALGDLEDELFGEEDDSNPRYLMGEAMYDVELRGAR